MRHFTVELEELNQKLLEMGGLVESAIHRSVRALVDQDRDVAEQVIRDEPRINKMEMEIDGMATRLLALRQPVARDLRFLTSALKINNDLERIGDLAQHVAERALSLMHHPLVKPMTDIPKMASLVQSMLLQVVVDLQPRPMRESQALGWRSAAVLLPVLSLIPVTPTRRWISPTIFGSLPLGLCGSAPVTSRC